MKDMPYSYRDVLSGELEDAWLRSRDPEDGEVPEMVLSGVGHQAMVVTPARIYRLSAGVWPFGDGGERVGVRSLADLVEARVREGLFLCRLNLLFASGEEAQLRMRTADRDKMRVAARMLATLSLRARETAKEEAIARQARAQAEAAAGRFERAALRPVPVRPGQSPRAEPPAGGHGGQGVASGPDVVELLRGLWQLVEVGALTGDEFRAKKADLLGRV